MDSAPTDLYTLSLHDALPILPRWGQGPIADVQARPVEMWLQSLDLTPRSRASIRGLLRMLWEFAMWSGDVATQRDRKSTRLNSSHANISYAVFCLKKKKIKRT